MLDWKDIYSVNVKEIDRQHKKLFEIGSSVFELVSLNDEYDHYDEIMTILNELKDYTVYHFDYEEKLLKKCGYENLDTHKFEHGFFVKKLGKMERKDIDGDQKEALKDLMVVVADWITHHIMESDMKYKQFFNERNIY